MSSDPLPIWGIAVIIVVIALNGYFSASRRAVTEANKVKIRSMADEGSKKALVVLDLLEKPYEYKLAIRAFNVLMWMVFCISADFTFSGAIGAFLENAGLSGTSKEILIKIIVILLGGLIMLSFGEVFPRRIAVIHAEGVAVSTSRATKAMVLIMKPMTVTATVIVFLILKLFRQRTDANDNVYSEDDIVEMLEAGQESGELKEEGKKMITGVFAFDDLLAYEIMTPRTDVFSIDINDPPEEYIDQLMELRYSRIPVYDDDSDNICGILYIKDYLIKAWEEGFDNVDIRSVLRKPYFVPETKNIDSLFVELQKTKQHIAILIDEYGGFSGIVTLEDIVEEVMGDIDDEYDIEDEEIKKIGHNCYMVEGSMNLDDLDEEINIKLESEDSETIGGFILNLLGEIPDENYIDREIPFENVVFTIKSIKDRRIEKIKLKVNK
ncbi:MAG: hemolysin family protein [Firmicutes bacterium]|nr:hemolysin family protein [Bacillota bacterium]